MTRFLHYCAVVDPQVMAEATLFDRLRYAIIGALVLVTASAAAAGWSFKAWIGGATLPVVAATAMVVALAVAIIERMLIATIPPGAGHGTKAVAAIWRAVLALLSSAAVVFPFMLWSFRAEIAVQLDADRIAALNERREGIERSQGIPDLQGRIKDADALLDRNATARETLPPDVAEAGKIAETCNTALAQLRKRTAVTLAANNRQRADANKQLAEIARQPGALQNPAIVARVAALQQAIAARDGKNRGLLAAQGRKEQDCAMLVRAFAGVKAKYYAGLDEERQSLNERRQTDQTSLVTATGAAQASLDRSRSLLEERAASGLQAETGALITLMRSSTNVRGVVIAYYLLSFIIELLPILSKIVMRSRYDDLMAMRAARSAAEASAAIAEARSEADVRKTEAAARRIAARVYYKSAKRNAMDDEIAIRRDAAANDARLAAFFAQFDRLYAQTETRLARLAKTQGSLDNPAAVRVLDALRTLLYERISRSEEKERIVEAAPAVMDRRR